MKLNDWHVMHDTAENKSHYFYGNLDEFDASDMEGLEGPIEQKDYTAKDWGAIAGELTRNRNHPWLAPVFEDILPVILSQHVTDTEVQSCIMHDLAVQLQDTVYHES